MLIFWLRNGRFRIIINSNYLSSYVVMSEDYCVFCDRANTGEERTFLENELFFARWEKNPVSEGHSIVISKKHIESFFELTKEELLEIHDLIKKVKKITDGKFHPDGYNIGVNEGAAAGRTIG